MPQRRRSSASSSAVGGTGTRTDPVADLQGSVSRLRLGNRSDEGWVYPLRPGEEDCSYFLRNGTCGYGAKCRYNHPHERRPVSNAAKLGSTEYPERVGKTFCEYFLKTGKCRFGPKCKYHHARRGAGPVSLNYSGYPPHQGKMECSYYVKPEQSGFQDPQPVSFSLSSSAPAVYPLVQHPSVPSAYQYPPLASWQVRGSSVLPTSYIPGSYGAVMFSPSVIPVSVWNPYPMLPTRPAVSPDKEQMVQMGLSYSCAYQSSPSISADLRTYHPISFAAGPSCIYQKEHQLPERPGQPICKYYMKHATCKFGRLCRYHHPPGWHAPYADGIFGPLPLRPGVPPCPFHAQHGICKFGPTCKYDHPAVTLCYSPSASSLSDIPVVPYPI